MFAPDPWDTAVRDWQSRLLSGSSLVPALPLFEEEAARALRIFKRLKLPDVIGNPTLGEAADPWIFDIVAAIFGAYDAETNRRMIQELFLLVPKKNGKSTYAAAIMVTAIIMNRRPLAELLLIAPSKSIADIAFGQAVGIIKLDPELRKLFAKPQTHIRTIRHLNTGAVLMVKAADTDAITGNKAYFTLVDETHEFAKRSNAKAVFVELRGALAARPDGCLIQITTQSKEPPAGVFKSELARARKVRDGEIRLPVLAVLYELPQEIAKDGGWKDERYWRIVNPSLGRSVDLTFLRNALITAEEGDADDMALLASQHFNVQVGVALGIDGWVGAKYWPAATDETLITLEDLIARCEVITLGIDGGGLDDLMSAAALGRCKTTRDWLHWQHSWAHDDVFQRKEIVPRLEDFIADGHLTRCRHPTQDVTEIADIAEKIAVAGLFPEKHGIGLDPVGIAALVEELASRKPEGFPNGLSGEMVVGIAQGYKQSGAVWGMERKLKDGTFWHGGQGMMAWVLGNARVEQRGNAVLITKQAAGKAKIDPLCASLNAFQLMSRNPQVRRTPQYQIMVVGR